MKNKIVVVLKGSSCSPEERSLSPEEIVTVSTGARRSVATSAEARMQADLHRRGSHREELVAVFG